MEHPPQHAEQELMHQPPTHAQHQTMHQPPQHVPRPTIDELYDQHDMEQEEYYQRSAAASLQRMHDMDALHERPTNPAIERLILEGNQRIHDRIREQELIDIELHAERVARWREEARRAKRGRQ